MDKHQQKTQQREIKDIHKRPIHADKIKRKKKRILHIWIEHQTYLYLAGLFFRVAYIV